MSDRICIFAGTTEGRRLAELLNRRAQVTVCVATEYGGIMLDGIDGICVRTGCMGKDEMIGFFVGSHFDLIIDATHPYAKIVTKNISEAADEAGIKLMRVLRESDETISGAVYVSCVSEAKDYLSKKEGNILITTGAKELCDYEGLDMSRVWARVLPIASSLEACEKAGIHTSHIIAAQGPFTADLNLAQMKMTDARYIVTKASGKNGGFEEKIKAARSCGAVPVIIGQPPQTDGVDFERAVKELDKTYPLAKRRITLVGIGPGGAKTLTREAERAIEGCDALIGAKSVIDALDSQKPCFCEYLPEKVGEVLDAHPSVRNAAVVLRGDTGFFSGAKKLLTELEGDDVTVIPGISSVSAFAARLGTSWEDAALISLHGREDNFIDAVKKNRKVFILTGGENTPLAVCRRLTEYGFGGLSCAVGERLTYRDERITEGTAQELSQNRFDGLALMYIENPDWRETFGFGISDERFVRGKVPMTKSEVRAVSIAKLEPDADSVIYDVGAGTGSVSVECALAAYKGCVYAVEKDEEALELIAENKRKFKADNIRIISGRAPEALLDLPAPTHAFIGGSAGGMREIIDTLLRKNQKVRIVVNTVTMESQAEAFSCAKEYGFELFEAVSVNISKTKRAGEYHLMTANNPVTVFVMQGGHVRG